MLAHSLRRHAPLLALAALTSCGAQEGSSDDRNNFGAGAASSGGAGAGGTPSKCTDCTPIGDGSEESGGYSEAEDVTAAGAAGGSSSLDESCGLLSGKSRIIESSLGSGSSFASAELTRELLMQGIAPLPQHVRTQDLLNYYPPDFDSPMAPANGADPNAPKIMVEMAPRSTSGGQNSPTEYDLFVAVQAPNTQLVSPPAVVVVLDTSQSMTPEGLERGKYAAASLISKLPEKTAVQVRTTDASAKLSAEPGAPRDQLLAELAAISILDGERPFAQALVDAYASGPLAQGTRVFAITDGADAPGTISSDPIAAAAENLDVVLNSIAVGPALEEPALPGAGAHGDRFFRALAWIGRGHYMYLDKAEEADTVFSQHLPAMLQTELRDVRVELLLPWHFSIVRSASEQTVNFAQTKPQNMGAGAVASFLYQLRTCDGKLPTSSPQDITITVRYKRQDAEFIDVPIVVKLQSLFDAPNHQKLKRALAIQAYAESLKTLDKRRLADAKAKLDSAASAFPDPVLMGLSNLLAQHPLLPSP